MQPPTLHGREAERAVLSNVLDEARSGRSGTIVLRGAPGIGKSALIAETVARAEGMRVLHAAGVQSESSLAYAALHQLLRPLAELIDSIPEPQGSALRSALALTPGGEASPFLVGAGVLSLLALAAEERPLLCVVEDAHWLDDSSTDALGFAVRRLEDEPVAFVIAAREGEFERFKAAEMTQISLEGLDEEFASALLEERVGAQLGSGVREQILEAADGNPLALLELPLALDADQLAGRAPLTKPLPVTTRLEEAFLTRAGSFSDESQLLLLIAAADDTGDPGVVLAAAGTLGIESSRIADLEIGGLLSLEEAKVEFRHPLVRSAVYQSAGFARRQAVHLALAQALTDEADADRRAWHLAAGTVGPDEAVAEELERSAERTRRRGGYASVAAALARAASLTAAGEKRAERQVAAAKAAMQGGQPRVASALVEEARTGASQPLLLAEIERLRGFIEFQEGSPALASTILLAAAADIEPHDPMGAARILADATAAAILVGDPSGQIETGRRAARLGAKLGPVFELTVAAGVGGLWDEDPSEARRLLEEALGQAEVSDNPGRFLWAALCSLLLGDETASRTFAIREVALARRDGAVFNLAAALQRVAFAEILEGRLASARANATEGLELFGPMGLENAVCYCHALLAWVAALLGREDEARRHAEETFEIAQGRGSALPTAYARLALGELELGLGHPDEALAQFEALSSNGLKSQHPYVGLVVAPVQVVAAVRAGRPEIAEAAVDRFEGWVTTTGSRSNHALLARSRALLSGGDEARDHFEEALRLHAEIPRPFERARTELHFGELLRRQGMRLEAREHLRSAHERFGELGAESWAVQAETELRASGATLRPRDLQRTDELTPQELQVARFVATGATNKEVAAQLFLSPRTVDAHLRSIFRKLGITSRSQLAPHHLGYSGE
jgi:DNA-binding CsgD family transcriptional regulator